MSARARHRPRTRPTLPKCVLSPMRRSCPRPTGSSRKRPSPAVPRRQPPAEAPARKKRSARSFLLPIVGACPARRRRLVRLQLLDRRPLHDLDRRRLCAGRHDVHLAEDLRLCRHRPGESRTSMSRPAIRWSSSMTATTRSPSRRPRRRSSPRARRWSASTRRPKRRKASLQQAEAQKVADQAAADNAGAAPSARRATAQDEGRHAGAARRCPDRGRPDQGGASPAPTRRSPAPRPISACCEAQYAEAQSTLRTLELTRDKAKRDLSFTVLRAPYDGVVGNRSVEQGDLISRRPEARRHRADGQALHRRQLQGDAARQAGARREGARSRSTPSSDHEFEGTVSSLAPASGAVFSLLPPENATGNFTKVVQRVPVRIDVPADVLKTGRLRAGLSVVVDVDSRTAPRGARTERPLGEQCHGDRNR